MNEKEKCCATCDHAESIAVPMSITPVLECHGGPPVPILVAGPGGAPTLTSVFPPVNPGECCAVWSQKPVRLASVSPQVPREKTGANADGKK